MSGIELSASQKAQLDALPPSLREQAMDELEKFESGQSRASQRPENPQTVIPRQKSTDPRYQSNPNEQWERLEEDLEKYQKQDKLTNESEALNEESPLKKRIDENLRPFGYELFNGRPTTFAPVTEIPIPVNYIVGPGDQVRVQFFGKSRQTVNLYVSRDGTLELPEIGPIMAAGKTFNELKQELIELTKEQMIGVKATISLGELRSIRILILGEANFPGSYTVSSLSTITNALFVSGGVSEIGSLRNIQLKRQGETVAVFDLYDLLLNGDTSKDVRLQPGDVLFIPPVGKQMSVAGEVKRPAIYELSEEAPTIQTLVSYAGGFTSSAYKPLSQLERNSDDGLKKMLDVDLSQKELLQTALSDGDLLRVYPNLTRVDNIVVLEGQAERPGNYQWSEGLRLKNIIKSYDDLVPDADLQYALVVSKNDLNGTISIRSFSPQTMLASTQSPHNLGLRKRDRIIIFNTKEEVSEEEKDITLNAANLKIDNDPITENLPPKRTRAGRFELEEIIQVLERQSSSQSPQKIVEIVGHVKHPGAYPLEEKMTLKDLVRAAGGFAQEAFTLDAELVRFEDNGKLQRETILVPVSLANENSAMELPLKPFDQLLVKRIPEWAEQESITLEGEVKFPGTYTIERGETLSSVIQRAGGLTSLAYPEAAIFLRESLKEAEETQLKRLKEKLKEDISTSKLQDNAIGTDTIETAEGLAEQLESTEAIGRLVIDLPSMLSKQNLSFNITLEGGDHLKIPQKPQSVTIVGSVNYPTSHFYNPNLSQNEYINLSGGTLSRADKKRIYIVRANGRVEVQEKSGLFPRGRLAIQPGDTIVVPVDVDRMKPLKYWGEISQIVYQLALGAAAVNSF